MKLFKDLTNYSDYLNQYPFHQNLEIEFCLGTDWE